MLKLTEERLAQLVAEQLKDATTYVDVEDDVVDGLLSEVIHAVLEVLDVHGPCILGD